MPFLFPIEKRVTIATRLDTCLENVQSHAKTLAIEVAVVVVVAVSAVAVAADSVQHAMGTVTTIFGHPPMEEARRWAADFAAMVIRTEAASTVVISRDQMDPPGEVLEVTRTNPAEA